MTRELDALKARLLDAGFRTAPDPWSAGNLCDWYAWRKSAIHARECERNDGNPAQIVIRPRGFRGADGRVFQNAIVEVCGQHGEWFKLQAYGLALDTLPAELPRIEASLIRAWNALEESAAMEGVR